MNDKSDNRNALRFMVKRLSRRTSTKVPFMRDIIDNNNNDKDEVPDPKTMNDMIQKTLTIEDTRKGKNDLVYFSYDKLEWCPIQKTEDSVINIFNQHSSYNHITDKAQEEQDKYNKIKQERIIEAIKIGEDLNLSKEDLKKSIRNQLTFAERTSQTINTEIIQKNAETAKLERNTHSGMVHKWEIFDKYIEKYIIHIETEKRKELSNKMGVDKKANIDLNEEINLRKEEKQEELTRPSMVKVLKLVEKQILQTLNEDQYKLYREWDKSENNNVDNQIAMVLPFPKNNSVKNRSVTAIVWNHVFEDLFAVGYGNYKFPLKHNDKGKDDREDDKVDDTLEPGYIFVFSVKNNHYPEIRYTTESWVLSLDFHKTEPYYLVAGTYDGNVCVYDIKLKSKFPIITCDIRSQKHMDPVWQVKWFNPDSSIINNVNSTNPNSNINLNETEYTFFSISSDGKVYKWSFVKNKTTFNQEEIVVLKYSNSQNKLANNGYDIDLKDKAEDNLVFGNSGGTCFDFNPHSNKKEKDLFIIGTEEGHIQLCSVNHRGSYIKSFEGHTMGVYSVAWNPYYEKMFASCSADWTIKIWHLDYREPLIIFDMDQAVGDLSWSPWCSSIFSCVTVKGQIKFFDLISSKKMPICEKTYKDTPINHISFNKFEYVFLTGNDSGKVRMWKMAESLRVTKSNQEEDEKEEEKKGAKDNQVQLTKVVLPSYLDTSKKKKRKNVVVNKAKKNEILKNIKHINDERNMLIDFLAQFDIYDEKEETEKKENNK